MNKNFLLDDFFKPAKLVQPISESDYINIQPHIESLITLARIANLSIYVLDFKEQNFLYVSSNPLFLCGYNKEDVQKMGYEFYLKIISEDDVSMLNKVSKAGFEYFYEQAPETRNKMFLSCDFRIQHANKQKYMINHKLTPFALTQNGEMWLSLCLVTLSTREKSGNVYIQHINSPKRIEYSFATRRWKPALSISLTNREIEILRLSAQGFTNKIIATELFIEESTVKYHKTRILNKFDVANIMEAVYFATANNMI